MKYLSSAHPFDSRNLISYFGLLAYRLHYSETNQHIEYIARLGEKPPVIEYRKKSFPLWWEEIILSEPFSKQGRFELTRKSIVLSVANTDGGGHVDEKLGESYAAFARENALGMFVGVGDPLNPEESTAAGTPIPPSIRQIAYEVLQSIQDASLIVFQKTNQKI